MFNTPKSVKSLRAYYKDRTAPASIDHLTQEVTGESDPAFVILLASILEDVLIHRVAKHLSFTPNETEFDHIFRFEGPLGTASARIEIAYLFGFIDERTRGQLDDIREMRNACAHSKQQMDFGVPVLANVAKRLFHPQGPLVLAHRRGPSGKPETNGSRLAGSATNITRGRAGSGCSGAILGARSWE